MLLERVENLPMAYGGDTKNKSLISEFMASDMSIAKVDWNNVWTSQHSCVTGLSKAIRTMRLTEEARVVVRCKDVYLVKQDKFWQIESSRIELGERNDL